MPIYLKDLSVGDSARVVGFNAGCKAYRKKLLAMGLTPGVEFTVTRFAPMGDPIQIRIRGFSMSLRRYEADALTVEKN